MVTADDGAGVGAVNLRMTAIAAMACALASLSLHYAVVGQRMAWRRRSAPSSMAAAGRDA